MQSAYTVFFTVRLHYWCHLGSNFCTLINNLCSNQDSIINRIVRIIILSFLCNGVSLKLKGLYIWGLCLHHCQLVTPCGLNYVCVPTIISNHDFILNEMYVKTKLLTLPYNLTKDNECLPAISIYIILHLFSSGGHHYDKNQVILNTLDPNNQHQQWNVEII